MTVRRWVRRTGIALLSLVVLGAVAYGALFIPRVYFRVALFMIERNSMVRDRVDWPTVRAEADQLLPGARNTRDTCVRRSDRARRARRHRLDAHRL